MPELSFSGVVLAGGRSSRMGKDKALIQLPDGRSLLQRQIKVLEKAGVRELFISGRPGIDYGDQPHPVLWDEEQNQGPLGGIAAAFRKALGSHLLVLAVDLPQMTTDFLLELMEMSERETGVVPYVEDYCEPLAACYPMAIRPLLHKQMQRGEFAVHRLVEHATAMGLLQRHDVGKESRELFRNWNELGDYSP